MTTRNKIITGIVDIVRDAKRDMLDTGDLAHKILCLNDVVSVEKNNFDTVDTEGNYAFYDAVYRIECTKKAKTGDLWIGVILHQGEHTVECIQVLDCHVKCTILDVLEEFKVDIKETLDEKLKRLLTPIVAENFMTYIPYGANSHPKFPAEIKVECVESYGGCEMGRDYWKVWSFDDGTEKLYVKFNGFYESHYGSEYESYQFVRPEKVTVTKWR